MSRALDRASLLDLAAPNDGGEWPTIPINPGFSEFWWADPQSDDFGENAVYFQYDPAEARALFEAAGVGEFEVPMHFASNVYNIVVPYYDVIRQALPAMLRDAGVSVREVPEEYSGVYIPRTFAGEFDGMALGLESVFSDVAAYWTNMFYPRDAGGGRNHSSVNDTELNDRIRTMLQQQDIEEIRSRGIELQKDLAAKMYYVPGINPIEYTARQPGLKGAVNVEGPTTYAVGTEGSLLLWLDA
jgi:ABC-type transport system substrate-binding protein